MRNKTNTFADPKKLKKTLKKNVSYIKKKYKSVVFGDSSGVDEWLRDNGYLLEREAVSALKSLKNTPCLPIGKDGYPKIYNICCEAVLSSDDLEAALHNALGHDLYSTVELDSIELMLKIALIDLATYAIKSASSSKMRQSITGLRNIPSIYFQQIIAHFSESEKILMRDPSGDYPNMSDETKSLYRKKCTQNARINKMSETDYVKGLLEKASRSQESVKRHIGYYLFENTQYSDSLKTRGKIYITMFTLLPAVAALGIAAILNCFWLAPIIYLPLRECVRPIFESLATKGISPLKLPRMEMKKGVEKHQKTLVTVSSIVPSADKSQKICDHLEELWQRNSSGEIYFCLLADLKEADTPNVPGDKVAINALKRRVKALNEKHGNKFLLLIRRRVPIKTQGKYAGFERKRGAITQLIDRITGEHVRFADVEGDITILDGVKYVLALDSDTELPMDTASELVSIASHPLNKPIINAEKGVVESGYGIISPRISTSLKSVGKTYFSQITGGIGGITAYDAICGNLYQDLFGSGIFSGKGLIDVEAFKSCMSNALPAEEILSHDVIEGSYLRTAYASDIEVCDGCPASAVGWLTRQHRWIRGDVQNLSRIKKHVTVKDGKIKNPIKGVWRYHIIDSVLREVSSVFAFIMLLVAFFQPENALFLVSTALNSVCAGALFSFFCVILYGGFSALTRKYYSRVLPEAHICLIRALLQIIMTVRMAVMTLDAVIRSLYRMCISKRRLLEWVTAADGDTESALINYVVKDGVSVVFGVAALVFGGIWLKIAGAAVLICPFVLYLLSFNKKKKQPVLSASDAERIKGYCAQMWHFFDENCNRENNWLPPDNIQFSPVFSVAHRTSPTNIGLMLLSVLAAWELDIIDLKDALKKLDKTITSIEKLEKFNGHFYNWYDTKTLKPLYPRYCSTVDIGNLACCLFALKNALSNMQDYSETLSQLYHRVDKIERSIDLGYFYDFKRNLFHIGYDVESNELSHSYYDLLMSEARMTSYYAIARRQVPLKHWGKLSRTLVACGSYSGPVSWTGTMFEYFMPAILLDVYENTMASEALDFCIHAQRRRAQIKNHPWGCSESGFYAFDAQFNYQYKAHGVQRLGLKRGLNNEFVVSPYSSFLVLQYFPEPAVKNLQRLEKMGLCGVYGFYEAVDFTKSRCANSSFAVVRSYMSHHVGMSMCSAANLLCGNIFRFYFMQGEMLSAQHVLEEKLPTGTVLYNNVVQKKVPEKPGRNVSAVEEFEDIQPTAPKMHLLSNGDITSLLTDCGAGISLCRGVSLYRDNRDLLRFPKGIYLKVCSEKSSFFVTRAPDYSDECNHRVEFAPSYAAFYGEKDDIEAGMSVSLHPVRRCEFRSIKLKNKSTKRRSVKIYLYLEPLLCKYEEERSHPAFSHLFVNSSYDEELKILTFTREKRASSPAISMAVGFYDVFNYDFSLNRSEVLTRPFGISSLGDKHIFGRNLSSLPDGCAAISFDVKLPPRDEKEFTLVISVASGVESAVDEIINCRNEGEVPPSKCAVSPLFDAGLEGRVSQFLLPCIVYGKCAVKTLGHYTTDSLSASSLNELWSVGLSGDSPIVLMYVNTEYDLENAAIYLSLHSKLREVGIGFDLCIVVNDSGAYERPFNTAVNEYVSKICGECLLFEKDGIYIFEKMMLSEAVLAAIEFYSVFIVPKNISGVLYIPPVYKPFKALSGWAQNDNKLKGLEVKNGVFNNGSFTITGEPSRPWSHIICKENFGTVVSDKSLGFTYFENSHEMRLTPWMNDISTDNIGEMLYIQTERGIYDIINGSQSSFLNDMAIYKGRVEDIKYRVEVSVSKEKTAKLVKLFVSSDANLTINVVYYAEPVLGVFQKNRAAYVFKEEDGVLTVRNPFSVYSPNIKMYLLCDQKTVFGNDRNAVLCGGFFEGIKDNCNDVCAAAASRISLSSGEEKMITFALGCCEGDAKVSAKTAIIDERKVSVYKNTFKINTPDSQLNVLFNDWLMYQVESSRINSRTGFYQSSGAYGFRDQLQDMCAYVFVNPDRAKKHVLLCCSRQFEQGDVMHWWHELPKGASGVRTRCSDDMLWLVYAVCQYIKATGDGEILFEEVPFLCADELACDEDERYFSPNTTNYTANILEHCKRAINRVKFGRDDLPLIGSCDWNDGFSEVGKSGEGTSVWLGEFLSVVANEFSDVVLRFTDQHDYAKELRALSEKMNSTVSGVFENDRYIRAFFDDGTPIGSKTSSEAKIDILPQAFAVFAGIKPRENVEKALKTAIDELVDDDNGIIKLFSPAFKKINAGYISSYPCGIRENGGQYTHGAVWLVKALFEYDMADEAYRLLRYINPISRSVNPKTADTFMLEPYSVPADIYDAQGAVGVGGWSQYTGAAGWLYRTILSSLLGVNIKYGKVFFNPNVPREWESFSVEMFYDDSKISFTAYKKGQRVLTIDGKQAEYLLLDKKDHEVVLFY